MSPDVLRRAAALMRERAENSAVGWTGPLTWGSNFTDAEKHTLTWQHYNSWHPAVALAVAEWLDSEAEVDDLAKSLGAHGHTAESHCVAVARAYLGAEVPA